MRRVVWWSAAAVIMLGALSPAMARPQYLMRFKAHFTTATNKPTLNAANCSMCHIGPPPQAMWNAFGQAVRTALGGERNVMDNAKIIAAFQAAERQRQPGSNETFGARINRDTLPFNPGAGSGGAGAPGAAARGWLPIFDGVSMNGWTKMNAGDWTIRNNALAYTGGGNGWLRSNGQYQNFSLVVTWRYTNPQGPHDSGVFLRAGAEGSPWPRQALQLNMGPGNNLGSLGGAQNAPARADLVNPPGQYNVYQLTVIGDQAGLAINGREAWFDARGLPVRSGHIGFQAEGTPVEFAQVWLMDYGMGEPTPEQLRAQQDSGFVARVARRGSSSGATGAFARTADTAWLRREDGLALRSRARPHRVSSSPSLPFSRSPRMGTRAGWKVT